VHSARAFARGLLLLSSLTIAGLWPAPVVADETDPQPYATLDGRPIPLGDVGRYFCDDFSYPEIRCSSNRLMPDARATLVTALTATDYVTIYDQMNYAGAYMHVSQDYTVLATIGWNDRISSYKGRNSETGTFFVDWFYGGAWYTFCCNQQLANLGVYNNAFSSIHRN
jgi:hypothetical protein